MNVDELLTELECALKAEESDLDRRVDVYNRIVSLAASYLHIPHPVVCPQIQFLSRPIIRGCQMCRTVFPGTLKAMFQHGNVCSLLKRV